LFAGKLPALLLHSSTSGFVVVNFICKLAYHVCNFAISLNFGRTALWKNSRSYAALNNYKTLHNIPTQQLLQWEIFGKPLRQNGASMGNGSRSELFA